MSVFASLLVECISFGVAPLFAQQLRPHRVYGQASASAPNHSLAKGSSSNRHGGLICA
jgi:hypothetical protein